MKNLFEFFLRSFPRVVAKRWRAASLRVHLLVQLSVALGIILVVLVYTSIVSLRTSTQEAMRERAVIARLIADRIDGQLDHALQMLESARNSEKLDLVDGNLAPEKELIQSLYEHSDLFRRIYLLDASGNEIAMAPYEERMVGANLAAPPYNIPIAQSEQQSFFPAMRIRAKTAGIALVLPIPGKAGGVTGYLYGWIDLADPRAAELLYPYEPGGRGYADLVDGTGLVIASTQPERIGEIVDHAHELATLIKNKQAQVEACHSCHTTPSVERETNVMAFAPLARVPWGVALAQPESEVFANTNAMTTRVVVVGLVVVLAFLGLVWVNMRDVISPLQMLTRACQQIAGGDLSHPIPPMGIAETERLASSFEDMRRDLQTFQERNVQAQHDLEQRVAERTSELTRYRDYLLNTNRNLTAVNAVSAILVHSLELSKTLDLVLGRVIEALSAEAAGILLLDEQGTGLVLAAQHGVPPQVLDQISRVTRADLFRSECNAPVVANPDRHAACSRLLRERFSPAAVLCAPLEEKDQVLGGLFVAGTRAGQFTKQDEALLALLGWQITMAVRNARLYEAVQHKEQERGEMLHRIIAAQEEERKRIARELHDETSQGLATLMLGMDTLDTALEINPRDVAFLQESNKAIAKQMLEGIRRITTDLRPSLLDDLGLVPAVAWYGEKRLNPLGITLHLDGKGLGRRLSPDLEIALFRIVQEAITNVIRHANASMVAVRMAQVDGHVVAEISDDGEGFDPSVVPSIDPQGKGLGLRGMEERIVLLGGEFHLKSAPGQGTTVMVSAPIRNEKEHVQE